MKNSIEEDILKLETEILNKTAEFSKLKKLAENFPDVRKYVGRWNKVAYYSKSVNSKVDRFDIRHNCGCCPDSPLEIWPYLETEFGKIYSDPPKFIVGEKYFYSDRAYPDWKKSLEMAEIPEIIIGAVSMHFKKCRDEAREHADSLYPEDDE